MKVKEPYQQIVGIEEPWNRSLGCFVNACGVFLISSSIELPRRWV